MRGWFIGAAATLAVCQPVQAQVGHLPESSPYKDMRIKQTISFVGGYLAGGRGSAGVGPSGGMLAGLRWDITVGAPTVLFLSVMRADLERRLVNPDDPPAAEVDLARQDPLADLEGAVLADDPRWVRGV